MNFSNKLCLLCLQNHDNLLEINGKQGIDLNIGTILEEHFWFEVDTFAAKNICENCWKNVESFHSFYNFVKSIHQKQTFEAKTIIDNGLLCSIKEEEPVDIKEVFDNFTDFPDTADSPAPICDEVEVNTAKEPAKLKLKRKYTRKTSASPPVKRYKTDDHTPLLSQYFNMACDLCDTLLPSYRETKHHYKDIHKRSGYLICCNRKYEKLPQMLSHCEWHVNPTAFNCKLCTMSFRDGYSLQQHCSEVHAPETEKILKCNLCDEKFSKPSYLNKHRKSRHGQKEFKCPLCEKCFTGKISVRYHIRDVHSVEDEREYRWNMKCLSKGDKVEEEDKSFECDICGNRFVLLSHLRSHMKRVHIRRNFGHEASIHSYICEICAKPFKTRAEQEKHYISSHTNNVENNVEKKVQCDICGKWLKHKYTLSGHMRVHTGKPATCKICGRVSSNLKALSRHIRTVHREPWLECLICVKKFKDKKVFKEHMAMHAGITDLYSCNFCTKTFRSNANMYAHRKRAHPAELEKMKEK